MKKEILGWVRTFVVALVFVLVIKTFVVVPIEVKGISMEPNFHNNDRIILNKMKENFERFDVVVVKQRDGNIIKRVIGLPGDEIEYIDDQLYINGEVLAEPFISKRQEEYKNQSLLYTDNFSLYDLTGKTKVPQNNYFVLGDNRPRSSDSREIGFVLKEQIIGRADLRYYPFSDFSISLSK